MINVFQPHVADPEVEAIRAVFASNWLGPGPRVQAFERAFGEMIGRPAEEVVAVTSATEGLFHAIEALGLGPRDQVVVPSISFIGAAHAVRSTGAQVVLCDVDPLTLNPAAAHIEQALTAATQAVLILHYGGAAGEVAAIAGLAGAASLRLIEDAAVSLGSSADGRSCGTFGDVGVWSFDSMKVLSTGDGGMVWCRDPSVTERIRRSIRLGVGSSGFQHRSSTRRWWEIDPVSVGRRGAMNDISAAMGLAQLEQLPSFLARRREVAATYDDALSDVPWIHGRGRHEHHDARTFYWIRTAPAVRDRLAVHLLEHGVYTTYKYWPLHKTRIYRSHGSFPGADRAAASTLLLPLHQGLSDTEVEAVIAAVQAFRA